MIVHPNWTGVADIAALEYTEPDKRTVDETGTAATLSGVMIAIGGSTPAAAVLIWTVADAFNPDIWGHTPGGSREGSMFCMLLRDTVNVIRYTDDGASRDLLIVILFQPTTSVVQLKQGEPPGVEQDQQYSSAPAWLEAGISGSLDPLPERNKVRLAATV